MILLLNMRQVDVTDEVINLKWKSFKLNFYLFILQKIFTIIKLL